MPYVVTESCIQCKYTDCVAVCPMDCFHAGPNFLVIDPDECIDCSICAPECPVGAIYPEAEVPPDQQSFIALNAQLSRRTDWPRLTQVQAPLADHAHWAQIKDKRDALVIAPE
ncbi:Ferredoxin 1 [Ralstonia condita]|jgi:ferredoxin|uniref:Ferredoxin n=1 Tax=Ralstonia condita TaxID=3058600 RepID=A0ABM9J5U1_9RALS|nr:ferredoxin FdxA [Ralstonia sp. LMG 7141]CAJ0783499.1 Ferredoxin 1 [Ralstonia sp. LMG 7141]